MSTAGAIQTSNITSVSTGQKGIGLYTVTGLSSLLGIALTTNVLTSPVILTNGNGGTITVNNIDATGDDTLTLLRSETDVSVGATANITPASTSGDYVGYVDIEGGLLLSGLLGDSATMTMQITLTLLAQLGIEETSVLNFGTIVSGSNPSVVRVAPLSGNRSIVSGTGASLVSSNPGGAGMFQLSGEPNTPVSIQVSPSQIVLSGPGGASMNVDTFNCAPATFTCDGSITIGITGNQTFSVGADLYVGANQPTGTYNGTYTVTINY